MNAMIRRNATSNGGFTLLEILVSAMMCAVILTAVQTLLYGALRLRETAEESAQRNLQIQHAVSVLTRDMKNIVAPGGGLADTFQAESRGDRNQRQDRVEFCTASGRISSSAPWGDVQKIRYSLESVPSLRSTRSLCLVRTITRNLLATMSEEAEYQVVLTGVRSLQLAYYDGQAWLDSWDSSLQDPPLPEAIHVRVVYSPVPDEEQKQETRSLFVPEKAAQGIPLELIIPVVVKPPAEEAAEAEASTGEDQESQPEDTGQGGTTGGPGGTGGTGGPGGSGGTDGRGGMGGAGGTGGSGGRGGMGGTGGTGGSGGRGGMGGTGGTGGSGGRGGMGGAGGTGGSAGRGGMGGMGGRP